VRTGGHPRHASRPRAGVPSPTRDRCRSILRGFVFAQGGSYLSYNALCLPLLCAPPGDVCINGGVTRVVALKEGRGASRVVGAYRKYGRACPESTGPRSRSPWHNRLSRWSPTIPVRYGLERKQRSRHSFASSPPSSPLFLSLFFYLSTLVYPSRM